MDTIKVFKISSEYLLKKYQLNYRLPENIIIPDIFALELKHIPINISNTLSEQNVSGLFFETGDKEQLLHLGSQLSINGLVNTITKLDVDYGIKISECVKNYFYYSKKSFFIDKKEYPLTTPYIMGIVNVTPDSFSDRGKYFSKDKAIAHALSLIEEGADIIDIGGESTRPGSEPVTLNEEFNRVIPVIEEILMKYPGKILSIDTTKSRVAYEALKRGVKIVNDISGLSFDPEILDVVKELNASLVIMHIKGTPKNMQVNPGYNDVVSEVYQFLEEKISLSIEKGVNNLFIDPGIGFGKRLKDNYELLLRLDEFKNLGYPILVGVSNKSFLGKVLNLDVDNRETATIAAETYSLINGARIIRTHNVKNAVQAKKLFTYFSNPELLS